MLLCLCFVVVAFVSVVVVCLRVDIFISFLVIALPYYARVRDDGNSSFTFLPVGFTSWIISPTICFIFCQYSLPISLFPVFPLQPSAKSQKASAF